jgi:hypothetical protein
MTIDVFTQFNPIVIIAVVVVTRPPEDMATFVWSAWLSAILPSWSMSHPQR